MHEGLFQLGGVLNDPLLRFDRPLHHRKDVRDLLLLGEWGHVEPNLFKTISRDPFDRRTALVHRDVLLNRVDPQLVCEKLDVVFLVVYQDACEVLVDGEVNPIDADFTNTNAGCENDAVFGDDLSRGLFDRLFGNEFLSRC